MRSKTYVKITFLFVIGMFISRDLQSQEDHGEQNHDSTIQSEQLDGHDEHSGEDPLSLCHEAHTDHHGGEYDAKNTAFHHISDQNVYSIGPWMLPLPCILHSKGRGVDIFMSSKFDFELKGHGDGHKAYKGYVLDGGIVKKVKDASFPLESVEISGIVHMEVEVDDEAKEIAFVCYEDQVYELESKSTLDFGVFGGGITSFNDFSITKNVVSMVLIFGLLAWMFLGIAKAYKERVGLAPKGVQSFFEPMILFIQDEVAIPFIGDKYEKYLPFLLCLFFFILALNLFGQIPFLGSSNVTGNLAVTMVLALFAFVVTNINGNRHYWQHIFWMPGVPPAIKLILTPVEVLGLFIKPLTLMLRLFANITAGHIVLLTFIGLIFIFGKSGESLGGSLLGTGLSIPLGLFMMSIELLVAFIQAFVFTILTASYIGAAIEEHH